MSSKERLEILVKAVGGRAALAKKLGVRYQTVNSWYSTAKISMSCVNAIHKALPWVNLNWLIFGEGDMDFYGEQHEQLIMSFEEIRKENERLKNVITNKIEELKKYDLRTNS